jgi:hypothetical protein
MLDDPYQKIKNEKFCQQLSTYFKRHMGFRKADESVWLWELEQEDFQTVLRAAGETETTQENIQDWVELDEGDPGFQLLTEEEIAEDSIKDSAMEEDSDNELDEPQ